MIYAAIAAMLIILIAPFVLLPYRSQRSIEESVEAWRGLAEAVKHFKAEVKAEVKADIKQILKMRK